jgi:serine protease Do
VNVEGVQQTPFGGQQQSEGLGSGVIYREDGYVVTNDHVVADADQVNVTFSDGSTEQARVVGDDSFTDLAVLKVPRNDLPAVRFAGEDPVAGQLAVAIGSPQGLESTVTSGVVSGLGREVPAALTGGRQEQALVDLVQTDAAISPGSSGGALVDRDGQLIGINIAYLPPAQTGAESIGFAIPASTVTSVADQLIETGEAEAPYLGIATASLSSEVARQFGVGTESGALIGEITDGGPASRTSLERGDVITAIGDTSVENSGDLLGALREYSPGDRVRLTVITAGEEREVALRLGERPESASSPGGGG